MDKTIEQLSKLFYHLARELQVYFISGLLILLNILAIDFFYYNNSLFLYLNNKPVLIPLIVIAYVIGHICMGFYYLMFELSGIEKAINKFLKINIDLQTDCLPELFKNNKEAYLYFIERYNILIMMRCTMCTSLLIISLTDWCFIAFKFSIWQILIISIFSFLCFIVLLILTLKSEKDYADKIVQMRNKLREEQYG